MMSFKKGYSLTKNGKSIFITEIMNFIAPIRILMTIGLFFIVVKLIPKASQFFQTTFEILLSKKLIPPSWVTQALLKMSYFSGFPLN